MALVRTMKERESLRIGEGIIINILYIGKSAQEVRVSIEAPKELKITQEGMPSERAEHREKRIRRASHEALRPYYE